MKDWFTNQPFVMIPMRVRSFLVKVSIRVFRTFDRRKGSPPEIVILSNFISLSSVATLNHASSLKSFEFAQIPESL